LPKSCPSRIELPVAEELPVRGMSCRWPKQLPVADELAGGRTACRSPTSCRVAEGAPRPPSLRLPADEPHCADGPPQSRRLRPAMRPQGDAPRRRRERRRGGAVQGDARAGGALGRGTSARARGGAAHGDRRGGGTPSPRRRATPSRRQGFSRTCSSAGSRPPRPARCATRELWRRFGPPHARPFTSSANPRHTPSARAKRGRDRSERKEGADPRIRGAPPPPDDGRANRRCARAPDDRVEGRRTRRPRSGAGALGAVFLRPAAGRPSTRRRSMGRRARSASAGGRTASAKARADRAGQGASPRRAVRRSRRRAGAGASDGRVEGGRQLPARCRTTKSSGRPFRARARPGA